jgi:antitoxin HigA-1
MRMSLMPIIWIITKETVRPMKNSPHPGTVVLSECIEPLGLTITQAAAALGVTRTTLSELVNGKRGISAEMAIRLSQVFGGSAQSWITQQAHYDFAQIPPGRIQLKRLAVTEQPTYWESDLSLPCPRLIASSWQPQRSLAVRLHSQAGSPK